MSTTSPFNDEPTTRQKWGKRIKKWGTTTLIGFGAFVLGVAVNPYEEPTPASPEDKYTGCEYVVPRDRTVGHYLCPAPVPDWPDKRAPANERVPQPSVTEEK